MRTPRWKSSRSVLKSRPDERRSAPATGLTLKQQGNLEGGDRRVRIRPQPGLGAPGGLLQSRAPCCASRRQSLAAGVRQPESSLRSKRGFARRKSRFRAEIAAARADDSRTRRPGSAVIGGGFQFARLRAGPGARSSRRGGEPEARGGVESRDAGGALQPGRGALVQRRARCRHGIARTVCPPGSRGSRGLFVSGHGAAREARNRSAPGRHCSAPSHSVRICRRPTSILA